jgi:hypothetical protein
MSNWLAYFGGAVVALLAALFAVPAMIDWNGYRGIFEEEATRVLGRDVRLGGSVNLRLLPAPYVSFEKMRISDPDSQTGEPLFRAESFTMWLALSPLLQGVLQANQVELKQPILKLAVSDDGSGNWSKLKLTPGALPFVPADVTLSSVKLSDGEIGLLGPKGNELAKLEAINGELTAEALSGPVRFRGQMKWGGELRDVRFASASPDPNGDVRFKVSATGTGTHSSYILDGRAANLGSKLSLTGELAAKIAPDLSAATRAPDAPAPPPTVAAPAPAPEVNVSATPGAEPKEPVPPPPPAVQAGAPLYDMRSKVSGDATGFKLSEIAITSEGGGPPQLVTGDAQATWGERTKLDLALNSRWIDLDAMFGTGKTVVPLEAARGLFDVLMRQLPASSDTNIDLQVDQLNLGADRISNVHFAAVRAGGPLEVKDFRVSLPGATQLSLAGKLAPGETSPKFEGAIGLKGQSLSRFLAWGLKRPSLTDGLSDGAFALNGNLKFSGKQIELADAKIGIGDTPVMAGVRLDLTERRRLTVNLEGQKIDIGRVWPGGLQMEALAPLLAQATSAAAAPAGSSATSAEQPWFDPANADLVIGVKAGSLVDGTRTLRNVEADLSVEGGKLAMRQLKFADDAGLEVELEGEAAGLKAEAKGTVRGLIVAPDAATAKTFVDLAGLDTYAPGLVEPFGRLAPLRLAGTLNLGARVPSAADLKLDGTVRGGRLVASVNLDGGFAAWRTAPAGVTARIEAPDVDQAASAMIGLSPAAGTAASGSRPGLLVFRAAGTPQDGLLSFAAIQSDGIKLDYSGRLSFPPDAPVALKGEAQIASRDARTLLHLAGLSLPDATSSVPLAGTVAIDKAGDTLSLQPVGLTVAGTPLAGTLTIKQPASGRTVLNADLQAGEASVTGLLAALLDKQTLSTEPPPPTPASNKAPPPPAVAAAVPPMLWPDQQFDFRGLDASEGKVTLRLAKLALQPGLSIANAKVEITLEPDRVAVTSLEGDAIGGKVTSTMTFAKAAGGISFDGGLNLRVPQGEGKPDIATLGLKYSGRALSPAALIAGLEGKGELKLGDISLGGMSPSIVGSVSEAALQGRGPNSGEPLLAALREGLREGQLKVGELAVPVTLADGAMKVAKVELDRPEGRTTFETVIELATMKLDSEWNVEARLPKSIGKAGNKLLPPVSVIYSGTLKDIAAIEPQISAGALERELTVRKMERDVEELERMRKEDETRAKEEQARIAAERERIKQERARAEAARAAAAAAAAVDDPQPAPDPNAGTDATVDQAPLPPAAASGQPPANAAQPQSNNGAPGNGTATGPGAAIGPDGQPSATGQPGNASAQQAAGSDPNAPPNEAAAAQAAPRPPAKRRPAPKDNWNPFTSQF